MKKFVYQKALIEHFTPAFGLHNNLCEFSAQIQKVILYSKTDLKRSVKDFWYTKINQTQIW